MKTHRRLGFTLIEIMVSLAIVIVLVLILGRILNSATIISVLGHKQMDADTQARTVLDRLGVDLAQMIKRADVDYYVKSSASDTEPGNDHLAFFSHVPGYYPSSSWQSPVSLVGYRINSSSTVSLVNKMERLGKGLLWNGASTSALPLIFGYPDVIRTNWPYATDTSTADPDSDYEVVGPGVFRFEYCYLLNTGGASVLSDTPGAPGLTQVVAIVVTLAAIDVKGRALLDNSATTNLIASLADFNPSMRPGDLAASWRGAVSTNAGGYPQLALSGIRIYERSYNLTAGR